ncbi:MAG TPA: zinc ribbon domain-containing protein [Candidatus Acidoferrum sp.]|jgi:putative FmdB family regulatory protein|nr:zinc ribbon domain-containing protein [Candidatus Acidoferrum sp.]
METLFLTTVSEPMPLYEYECEKCGHRFEKIQKFSDKMVKKCPECGGKVEQMISAPAVQFKGSGWYVTDYANKSHAPSDGGKDSKKEDKSKSEGSSKDSSAKEGSSSQSSSKEVANKDSSSKDSPSKDSSSKESSSKESTNRVSSSRKPDKRK